MISSKPGDQAASHGNQAKPEIRGWLAWSSGGHPAKGKLLYQVPTKGQQQSSENTSSITLYLNWKG